MSKTELVIDILDNRYRLSKLRHEASGTIPSLANESKLLRLNGDMESLKELIDEECEKLFAECGESWVAFIDELSS